VALPLRRRSLVAYNGYDAGLGNRVRVVLGAKSLAELEGRAFYYVWPTGRLFGPAFSDLWSFSAPQVSRTTSRILARFYPYVDESLTWLTDERRQDRLWQIRTGSPIRLPAEARSWEDELRSLELVDDIARTVTTFFDRELRGVPYVGVMIRAHVVSHQRTKDASPVDWFVARMQAIAHEHPGVRFFVSCDVPEVQQQVFAAVPGCVGLVKTGRYNSTDGLREAVADLYLLACADYLIGPHFSSFVHLAEYLAGGVLTFETSVNDPGVGVDLRAHGLAPDPLKPFVRAAP
jgi:hypothetical protein